MFIILLLLWFILSEQVSLFFISAAIVSIIFIRLLDRKLFPAATIVYSWSWLVYAVQLLKAMLLSTFDVMQLIWLKPHAISPCRNWIDISSQTPLTQVVTANSITLTPGTMTMNIKDNKILVHALTIEAMEKI